MDLYEFAIPTPTPAMGSRQLDVDLEWMFPYQRFHISISYNRVCQPQLYTYLFNNGRRSEHFWYHGHYWRVGKECKFCPSSIEEFSRLDLDGSAPPPFSSTIYLLVMLVRGTISATMSLIPVT